MSNVILVDATTHIETEVHHSKLPDGAFATGRFANGLPEYVVGFPEDVEIFLIKESIKRE